MMIFIFKKFVLNKGLSKVEQFYDKFGKLFDSIEFDIGHQKGKYSFFLPSVHSCTLLALDTDIHRLGVLRQPIHSGLDHHIHPIKS